MNKCVLITGATRGIGKEIAITLAQNGYNLAINYRNKNIDLEEKMIQRPLGVNVLMPSVTNQNFMSQYMEQVNITTHRAVIVDVGHMYLEKIKMLILLRSILRV